MRSPSPVPAPAALDPRRHSDDEEEEVGATRQPNDPLTQRERDDMNSLVNKRMTVAVEASRPRQPDLPRPPISSYLRDIGSSPFVDRYQRWYCASARALVLLCFLCLPNLRVYTPQTLELPSLYDYDSKIAMEESRMREMKQHMQWRTEVETLQRQQQQLESVSAPRTRLKIQRSTIITRTTRREPLLLPRAFVVHGDLKSVPLTTVTPRAFTVGSALAQRRASRGCPRSGADTGAPDGAGGAEPRASDGAPAGARQNRGHTGR